MMKRKAGRITRRDFIKISAVGLGAAALGTGCSANLGQLVSGSQQLPETIDEAGKRLRNGSLTSEQLTKAYIEGINKLEPKLNAFITRTNDLALKTAAQMDAELKAGKDRGPLHGIPIVHKDLYDTAGIPTTVGSEFFRKRVPTEDATVVRKLKEAGTVMLGKTNMNEFAAGISGTNQFYGDIQTIRPWINAKEADPPIGGANAGNVKPACGYADGSSRIGPGSAQTEPGYDCRPGSA
jgi:aspartyl-tRNA(Asn)/glutamyl-tRNA(Gln) amidotransferase subunit A